MYDIPTFLLIVSCAALLSLPLLYIVCKGYTNGGF